MTKPTTNDIERCRVARDQLVMGILDAAEHFGVETEASKVKGALVFLDALQASLTTLRQGA